MPNDFQTALTVLLIGMFTVFVVLTLVIYTAKTVIWGVNRLTAAREDQREHLSFKPEQAGGSRSAHLAAIVAAVDAVTEGQGRIERIEWLE